MPSLPVVRRPGAALALVSLVAACSPGDYALDDVLTLSHLQMKGTHNSYHVSGEPQMMEAWEYTHQPLDVQFAEQGVRAVELDVNYDRALGYLEVFHIADYDELTTCRAFTDCLKTMRAWSVANDRHHPIFVHVEPKDVPQAELESFIEMLEAEILSVFPKPSIVTPDEVKGGAATLREAVKTRGWPTLGRTRGRFVFYLDDASDVRGAYTRDLQNLDGRLAFVNSSPEHDFAAIAVINDPLEDAGRIREALDAGLIVRTRADGDTDEARLEDTDKQRGALASGAQIISTDFPVKVTKFNYEVKIPGGTPSRCNPVTAPKDCTSLAIEDPALLKTP